MVPKVVFVLGGPGAAGDLLRAERSNPNSEYRDLIENYIREGKIVPVDITCGLLEHAMEEEASNDKFLIDGFPRNDDNLEGWSRRVADKVHLLFVLYFNCPAEICTARCLMRGATGSGRSDDNLDSLRKRFNTYIKETQPIVDYYRSLDLLREVNASQPIKSVFADVKGIFKEIEAQGDIKFHTC
ncbi:hypothetical protein FQA39_LY13861 [Lamprigera yunnana]|nr:hypothetical protein FQA39_LY13861 [Lamprigera yunnana]